MTKIITNEQRTKIVTLSNEGYQNRQIAIECGMKYSTLCYWKARLREKGISLPASLGRPKKGTKKDIRLIGTMAELARIESEDQKKREDQQEIIRRFTGLSTPLVAPPSDLR